MRADAQVGVSASKTLVTWWWWIDRHSVPEKKGGGAPAPGRGCTYAKIRLRKKEDHMGHTLTTIYTQRRTRSLRTQRQAQTSQTDNVPLKHTPGNKLQQPDVEQPLKHGPHTTRTVHAHVRAHIRVRVCGVQD